MNLGVGRTQELDGERERGGSNVYQCSCMKLSKTQLQQNQKLQEV